MNKTHLYFVPGLAANSKIFERIQLPEDQYEMHFLEWLIPVGQNEPIEHYAQRMCDRIEHENPVLIGVSFGGIMVQEMSKLIKSQKTILISSIKNNTELPKRLKTTQFTRAYKLFPSSYITTLERLLSFIFGKKVEKRIQLYDKYLSVRNQTYLNWAIYQILHWKQKETLPNILHIHGEKDEIFPIKHIKNCIIIEKGKHIMILNKAKKINNILQEELSNLP